MNGENLCIIKMRLSDRESHYLCKSEVVILARHPEKFVYRVDVLRAHTREVFVVFCCGEGEGEGEGEVKLRKGVEAKRRQEQLIEGRQTLLTGNWGPPASPSFLIQGICSKSDIYFSVRYQGLPGSCSETVSLYSFYY